MRRFYMKMVAKLRMTGLLLLIGCVTGCAAAPVAKTKERFFWPPPPDNPRIEWLAAYSSTAEFKGEPSMLESILGSDEEFLSFNSPLYVTADGNGKVYVSDQGVQGVLIFDLNAKEGRMLGGADSKGRFQVPTGIAIDGEGNIYVADSGKRKIFIFDASEKLQKVFDLANDASTIGSIALDKGMKRLYVPDVRGHKIIVLDLSGRILQTIGGTTRGVKEGEFTYPTSVFVDREGNLVVCDSQNARIQRFKPDGTFINAFGKRGDGAGQFNLIKAAAVDSEGHVYVTDGKSHRVSIMNDKGEVLMIFGGTYAQPAGAPIAPGGFLIPQGIYIDEKYLREHPITDQKVAAPAGSPTR
jgi:DNA-binding beta-propeller fold protein YncE